MADHVGACTAVLMPLYELIKAHVFAAARIHGDDTTVPVLARCALCKLAAIVGRPALDAACRHRGIRARIDPGAR